MADSNPDITITFMESLNKIENGLKNIKNDFWNKVCTTSGNAEIEKNIVVLYGDVCALRLTFDVLKEKYSTNQEEFEILSSPNDSDTNFTLANVSVNTSLVPESNEIQNMDLLAISSSSSSSSSPELSTQKTKEPSSHSKDELTYIKIANEEDLENSLSFHIKPLEDKKKVAVENKTPRQQKTDRNNEKTWKHRPKNETNLKKEWNMDKEWDLLNKEEEGKEETQDCKYQIENDILKQIVTKSITIIKRMLKQIKDLQELKQNEP